MKFDRGGPKNVHLMNVHSKEYTVRQKKLHPLYFLNNFVKSRYTADNFWCTDTWMNLQQNNGKIGNVHLS